jgi:hypothetical protein
MQLPECLVRRFRRAGAGSVERLLRGIQLAHDEQRLAICLRQVTVVTEPFSSPSSFVQTMPDGG